MRTPLLRRSSLLGAVAHVVSQELALFGGGCFQLRADEVAHRGNPLGYGRPRLAVPLLEEDGTTAFVIFAGDLERVRETLHPELLEALVGQAQVLESPPDLLAGEGRVAIPGHGRPDRFHLEHGADQAAVVEDLADGLALAGALALVVDVLDDLLVHLEARARSVERRADVPFGGGPSRGDVAIVGRPPVPDEVIHRVADRRRLLDCYLVHHAPA